MRADKGNVTVVMRNQVYKETMNSMLKDNNTYKKIETDPLKELQKSTFKLTDNWRLKCYLGNNIKRKEIITANTNLARIYGSPKIDKINYPLRPVVSCINTTTFSLVKALKKILFDSLPKPKSFVKNSIFIRNNIIEEIVLENHVFVSLDMSSLFTNVPLELVLKGIKKRWDYMSNFTKIPLDDFKNGISFLMDSTFFFKFNNAYYKQTFGTPIGSPISSILADIVMEDC